MRCICIHTKPPNIIHCTWRTKDIFLLSVTVCFKVTLLEWNDTYVKWLQQPTRTNIGGRIISVICWANMGLMTLGTLTYIQQASSPSTQCLSGWDGYWKAEKTNLQVLIKFQQNLLKQEVEQFILGPINLLINSVRNKGELELVARSNVLCIAPHLCKLYCQRLRNMYCVATLILP